MNWDAIGAIAESVGALGVILSLIYLSTQVKQNTAMMKRESSRETSSRLQAMVSQQMALEVAEPVAKVHYEDTPLSKLSYAEQIQLDGHLHSHFAHIQDNYDDFKQGIISSEKWEPNISMIKINLKPQAAKEWWRGNKYNFTSEFQSLVEKLGQ